MSFLAALGPAQAYVQGFGELSCYITLVAKVKEQHRSTKTNNKPM